MVMNRVMGTIAVSGRGGGRVLPQDLSAVSMIIEIVSCRL